jgi:hypothetical protein
MYALEGRMFASIWLLVRYLVLLLQLVFFLCNIVFFIMVAWLLWCSIWMSLFYFETTPSAGLVHVLMDHSHE